MISVYSPKALSLAFTKKSGLVPAEVVKKLTESKQIIQQAEEKAKEIIAGAEAAFAAEKERGYKEGQIEAEKEQIEFYRQAKINLDKKLGNLEDKIINLIKVSVEKIFYDLDVEERAKLLARQGLSALRQENRVRLKMSPELLNDFKDHIEQWQKDFPEIEVIDLISDSGLKGHQIVLESSFGKIEPKIETISGILVKK